MLADNDLRIPLLNIIRNYAKNINHIYDFHFSCQRDVSERFQSFIIANKCCFDRENIAGHITGSALVVDKQLSRVLLTYHAKLQKWLQLGGHADGEYLLQSVALKEAQEESGIMQLQFIDIQNFPRLLPVDDFFQALPFDLDIHQIPAHKNEFPHAHYDVRFLLMSHSEDFFVSSESLALKWIDIAEVPFYTTEPSTLRQIEKLRYLKSTM